METKQEETQWTGMVVEFSDRAEVEHPSLEGRAVCKYRTDAWRVLLALQENQRRSNRRNSLTLVGLIVRED